MLEEVPDSKVPAFKEQCWFLVERVAASTQIRRSARLRDLLLYVGRQSLFEPSPRLQEQQVGESVFGRADAYDTSQDNIVRVNMTELRKRVDQYFAGDGVEEAIVFAIPRGSYGPEFRKRHSDAFDQMLQEQEAESPVAETSPAAQEGVLPVPLLLPPPTVPAETGSRRKRFKRLGWIGFGAMLLVIAGLLEENHRLERRLHPWNSQPALRAFWKPFFGQGRITDLVLADSSFALAQDLTHRQLSLNDYLSYRYEQAESVTPATAEAKEQEHRDLKMILGRSTGSLGDFRVAMRIAQLDEGQATQLRSARDYSADSLRHDNAILLGSPRSNPWVEIFADRMSYKFGVSADRTQALIRIEHPQNNELAEYSSLSDPATKSGYCVIALLPNLSGGGDTLIIAGTDSQATEAAGEFLTNEMALEQLLTRLKRDRFGHFQLLLRTERLNATPLGAEIVSVRP